MGTNLTPRSRIALLVPAYNVDPWKPEFLQKLSEGLRGLAEGEGCEPWLVFVDDGSTREGTTLDHHLPRLGTLPCRSVALRHHLNRGQGAALQTALEVARSEPVRADYFVTFDADDQHDPADVTRLLRHLRSGRHNIVFGNRFDPDSLRESGIPWSRRTLLRAACHFDRIVTGLKLQDAHNGLRIFDAFTAARFNWRQDGMAHATEIKSSVRDLRLRYGELPVKIRYDQNTLANGQNNLNAVNIVRELLEGWWFR